MPAMTKAEAKNTIEYKTLSFKVETVDEDQGIITGYLSTFNNIDLGNGYIRDRVRPGAFKRTISNAIERKNARGKKYLWPHLWMHSPEEPIGGYVDAKEDSKGLLVTYQLDISKNSAGIPNNPTATMVFSGYKYGYIDEQSIGYEVIRSNLVDEVIDGEKNVVRDLLELRLWEGSSITSNFAMNPEATVTAVKSMNYNDHSTIEYKSVCGNTSGPIGPRDESWDGSAAKSWIWSQALDDEGNVKPAVAKRYFMQLDGDPTLKGSYGYPFWTQGHISVGGVKAVAGALSGARNADAGGDTAGMKRKVETLYRKINKKYADADPLVPPWKDDGKSATSSLEYKDLADHFQDNMAEDLCEDWQDVYLCSLTCAVFDALQNSDDPEADVSKALDDFKAVVMSKFVTQAVEYDLSSYLEDNSYSANYLAQYGNDSRPNYGMMSRRQRLTRKEMLAGDATTGGFYASSGDGSSDATSATKSLVGKLHQVAEKAMKTITDHVAQVHNAADEVTTLIGGSNEQTPTEKALPFVKAGRSFSGANAQALSDHADALHDMADAHQKAMTRQIKAINNVADDLADILQGSEAAYGTDPGTPDSGRQEGKSSGSSYAHTRASAARSSDASDTVSDDEIATSLQKLKALRVTA